MKTDLKQALERLEDVYNATPISVDEYTTEDINELDKAVFSVLVNAKIAEDENATNKP